MGNSDLPIIKLSECEAEKLKATYPNSRIKEVEGYDQLYILRGVPEVYKNVNKIIQNGKKDDIIIKSVDNYVISTKTIEEKEIDMSESWEQVMKKGIISDINKEIEPLKNKVIDDIGQAKTELEKQIEQAKEELKQLKQLDARLKAVENCDPVVVLVGGEKKEKKKPIVEKIDGLENRIAGLEIGINNINSKFDKIILILKGDNPPQEKK